MIRVFVGCAPNHEDLESQSVFEWSLRKHASEPVAVEWMRLSRDPASPWFSDGDARGWRTERWATPFSGFRWAIPAICNFEGRAIYSDSDVIWLADVAELARQAMAPGKVALAKAKGSWRFCVSLWDCAATKPHMRPLEVLRADPMSHRLQNAYFAERPELIEGFAGDWNCLDGEGHADLADGALKALHYTDMSCQPQLRHALPRLKAQGRSHWFNGTVRRHPRADVEALFDRLLDEARANGYGPERYAQQPPFGPLNKKSLTGYRGRAVA
jgi:hypothetical protein